ncbi:hypothetical protein [Anaerobacillus sp. 1_MG-2023]|uniref:hypothetical protein n=1 Tax=Anaerobacillus sp. 1_MG-2023 TaxID=3062655 RepID=UPI0026E3DBE8|nr:hypothetical protein [Anaerobacillus sp. 1_MG-2023]MDO6657447.1 hypothetical protein [Anaerobacillus sp. 1_MG-2023]
MSEVGTHIIECADCQKVFRFDYDESSDSIKVGEIELLVIKCPECEIWEAVSDQRFKVFNILGLVTDSTILLNNITDDIGTL